MPELSRSSDQFATEPLANLPKRAWDTGLKRPYRPCPPDFRETFLALGQSKEIEEHYRTNWRVIRRWIEECGGDALRAERRLITGMPARPYRRSKISLWGAAA